MGGGEDYPRTPVESEARFATDEACRAYLCQLQWPEVFRCPRCGQIEGNGSFDGVEFDGTLTRQDRVLTFQLPAQWSGAGSTYGDLTLRASLADSRITGSVVSRTSVARIFGVPGLCYCPFSVFHFDDTNVSVRPRDACSSIGLRQRRGCSPGRLVRRLCLR